MKQLSTVVQTVANISVPFILVFGGYIILHGHLSPGGGFQGGAVVASAFALIFVSYDIKRAHSFFRKDLFSLGESGGLMAFLSLAFAGIGTAFFYNILAGEGGLFGDTVGYGVNSGILNSAGLIPLMNIAVAIEVFSGFGVILLSMIFFRNDTDRKPSDQSGSVDPSESVQPTVSESEEVE